MKPRHLPAVLMLLLIGMSCFLSTPVLSGEHPWDVDRTGGGGHSGEYNPPTTDSTRVATTDGAASVVQRTTYKTFGSWYGLIGRITVHLALNQTAARNHGLDTKGKAER